MKPWQKALRWFTKFDGETPFHELLAEYIKGGFVWCSPDSFLLAKPAFWDGKTIFTETDSHNAWFIHLAAGSMKDMLRICPYPLDFIVFQRHGQERFHAYSFNILKTKVNGIES